ncbi:glycosyltransferase [Dyella japonica]|uniref:glycosyltransferase n=1 Tax=Dyella japonica TaxID=231455 RepID=UPI0002E0344A|nr:glycosyltransferase [Dyella japonica]
MVSEIRPKLLVLASTYPRWRGDHEPGFVHELCRRMRHRFDITVLTSHARGARAEEIIDGVRVVRYRYAPVALETLVYGGGIASNLRRSAWKYGLVPTFLLAQYLRARALVRKERIDAIHAHWLIPQGSIATALGRRLGIPVIVTSHGGDLYGLRGNTLRQWKREVAAAAAAMTVVSSAMALEARAQGLQSSRLCVLPMGVDLKGKFVPDEGVERRTDELLFVGRLVPKKGLRYLLDAMPLIVTQRPGVMLTIAGFGPEEAALRAQASRLGLEAHVTFLGAVPQDGLPALYRRASLLVAPFVRDEGGDQEGLPVVLMEAIGCGCPVVAGRVLGVEDLLGPYHAQLSVEARDPLALMHAIVDQLNYPTEALARARELREAALGFIDWDCIAGGYGDLIVDCLKASSCHASAHHAGDK